MATSSDATTTAKVQIGRDTRLLFIGDSITDCDRRADADGLGNGYVRLVRDHLCAKDPASAPVVLNLGVGGNRVPHLQARWKRDVLDLRPDVLSVYIGINDVWHGLVSGGAGSPLPDFVGRYRDVLGQARQAFPDLQLVLCEPSVLWLPEPAGANDRLKPYVAAVHDLAGEFAAAAVVELHGTFERANAARPEIAWTTDGVHPTSTGHMLIARTWLAATGLL